VFQELKEVELAKKLAGWLRIERTKLSSKCIEGTEWDKYSNACEEARCPAGFEKNSFFHGAMEADPEVSFCCLLHCLCGSYTAGS